MSLDLALFRLINIRWGTDALAPVMRAFSNPVYGIPLFLALVLWMLFRDGARGRAVVLVLLLLVPAADQLSSHVLKPLVHRPRPCRVEAGIAGVKNHGAHCSSRGSFPSSHAVNTAAVAVLLALIYRKWAVPAAFLVLAVGYSRVYLGVHYPSDILGGWLVGGALGAGAAWLAARVRKRWGDRLVRHITT